MPAESSRGTRGRRLVVLSGPSGCGKSTICRMLAQAPGVWRSVSATTRAPRPGEVDGVDYRFLTRAAFERGIAAGQFIEHAQVFGEWYGTPRPPLEAALAAGQWAVLDIDVQGGRKVRRLYPEATLIFVVPPSPAVLERRLRDRGTESPEAIARRLAEADRERQESRFYDHIVVNNVLEKAVAQVRDILKRKEP